jgi:hypothetical protein
MKKLNTAIIAIARRIACRTSSAMARLARWFE